MSWVTTWSRSGMLLAIVTLMTVPVVPVSAASLSVADTMAEPPVIITEVQMTGDTAAEEFIELYNTTDTDIDLTDAAHQGKNAWKLHFYTSSDVAKGSPDWSKPATVQSLSGVIPARSYFVIASTAYETAGMEADQYYRDRLASRAGGLQLVSGREDTRHVHDRLLWSSAVPVPDGFWPSPAYGESMQRTPNDQEEYMGTDMQIVRFVNHDLLTPGEVYVLPLELLPEVPPETEDDKGQLSDMPVISDSPVGLVSDANVGLLPPIIAELLANPAAPLKDETDEYIELYNPNAVPFVLKGYSLEVGLKAVRAFTFTDEVAIPALGYIALYAEDTRLTLANSGGQVKLLNPSGMVLSETEPYVSAKDGMAWGIIGGTWQWTSDPTPGRENRMENPVMAPTAATVTARKAAAKAASGKVKGVSTVKAKKVKTAKVKAVKAKAKKEPKEVTAPVASIAQVEPRAQIHTGVLVVVAGLAVLYGAYEYRHDISNRIHQFRHHRTVRVRNGRQIARR